MRRPRPVVNSTPRGDKSTENFITHKSLYILIIYFFIHLFNCWVLDIYIHNGLQQSVAELSRSRS